MPAVAHQDRVVARDPMIVEPDLRRRATAEVGDVAVEPQQSGLRSIAERQVLAAKRELGSERRREQPRVEQREGVDRPVRCVRRERVRVFVGGECEWANW